MKNTYEKNDFVKCYRCGCPRIVHIEHKGLCVHCLSVGEKCESFTHHPDNQEVIIAFTNKKLELYALSVWCAGLLMGVGFMSMISVGGWTGQISFYGAAIITIYLFYVITNINDFEG